MRRLKLTDQAKSRSLSDEFLKNILFSQVYVILPLHYDKAIPIIRALKIYISKL